MRREIEHKVCRNCKQEIPHHNYVLHTVHCERNITLCVFCKEPIPKNQFAEHRKSCMVFETKPSPPQPPIKLELSPYYRERKAIEDKKAAERKERLIRKYDRMLDPGYTLKDSGGLPKKQRKKYWTCGDYEDEPSHNCGFSLFPKPPSPECQHVYMYNTTPQKRNTSVTTPLLPTTTTESTHSTAAGASVFIPKGTAGGSRHQPLDDENASGGDAPVYGATSREKFRVDAGQLPCQPPKTSAPIHHDVALPAEKPVPAAALSLQFQRSVRPISDAAAALLNLWPQHKTGKPPSISMRAGRRRLGTRPRFVAVYSPESF